MLFNYGIAVQKISDVVRSFNLEQQNYDERHFIKNMEHARWAWKELFRDSYLEIKQAVIKVNVTDHTITLPNDVLRLINISVVDKYNNLQPIGYNPNMNTAIMLCPGTTCSCKNCKGQDTLCSVFDNLTFTEEAININGTDYIKKSWARKNANGDVMIVTEMPYLDDTGTVQWRTSEEIACNLDLTEEGCIKPTEPNIGLLTSFCGCFFSPLFYSGVYGKNWWEYKTLVSPKDQSYFGHWNWDAARGDKIHLSHEFCDKVKADKVIVAYQTNGESIDSEVLVPDYATDTLKMGIMYRQKAFSPTASSNDKQFAKYEWRGAKTKMNQFLRPVRMTVLSQLQDIIPYWGPVRGNQPPRINFGPGTIDWLR